MESAAEQRYAPRRSGRALEDGLMLLAGIGAGLAAMYLLDPKQGSERRQYLRRRAGAAMETAGETLGSAWNNVSSKASDVASNIKERGGDVASDWMDSAREMIPRREPEHHYIGQTACALGSLLLGAGVTYLFDPDRGSERRERLSQAASGAVTNTADFFVCAFRSAGGWFRGESSEPEREFESEIRTGIDPAQASATAP